MKTKIDLPQHLIVFSHLRWDFVKQRPQHLLERLSSFFKVLFVEEPKKFLKNNYPNGKYTYVQKNIEVFQPNAEFPEYALEYLQQFTGNLSTPPILWFYSPAFIKYASHVEHSLVIYDCMDQLSAFNGASPKLERKEKSLLGIADLVFTGGKSLYEEKSQYHPNVFCFPSSVHPEDFRIPKNKAKIPADIARIPHPIVGFYGVVDERMDVELLETIARALPQVSFVIIGPTAKIDKEALPHLHNIYYLGKKKYALLPHYLHTFDVAFMPFALNKATQFISPTKTLEFMAALKPIVSTPIKDVLRDYKKAVFIAKNAEMFTKGLTQYLRESLKEKKKRIAIQEQILKKTSWDKTAENMMELITEAYRGKTQRQSSASQEYFPFSSSLAVEGIS